MLTLVVSNKNPEKPKTPSDVPELKIALMDKLKLSQVVERKRKQKRQEMIDNITKNIVAHREAIARTQESINKREVSIAKYAKFIADVRARMAARK